MMDNDKLRAKKIADAVADNLPEGNRFVVIYEPPGEAGTLSFAVSADDGLMKLLDGVRSPPKIDVIAYAKYMSGSEFNRALILDWYR